MCTPSGVEAAAAPAAQRPILAEVGGRDQGERANWSPHEIVAARDRRPSRRPLTAFYDSKPLQEPAEADSAG